MRKICNVAVWLMVWAMICRALWAQGLAGYTRHVWQGFEGLPEQTVQAFAQTRDGYLWIGTTGGLVRFDGAHFAVFDRQNTPALNENNVFCLVVSRDGALWIGTEGGGIVRYQNGAFRSWTTREGLSNDFVRALYQDSAGTIWAGSDNGLMQFKGDRFVRVDDTPSIPAISVHSIYQDREGRLWAGGFRLACIEHMTAKIYSLGPELSQNMVKSITQTQDGTVWVGTVSGLERMPAGKDSFQAVKGISSTVRVLRETPDGVLWIGTIGQGAFQYKNGSFTRIPAPAQLPSNTVLNFFEDGESNFWIGTQTGMLRLTRSPVSILPFPMQNDADFGTIYQDRDGSFWIASAQLFHLKDGVIVPEILPGLHGAHVRNIFRDRAGVLWAGTDGEGLFRIAGGQTTHITSLANNYVRAIAQAPDGSLWVGTDGGLNHIVMEQGRPDVHPYSVADGLVYPSIRALLSDHTGDLWVGTERGLSHIHGSAFAKDLILAPLAQMKVWAIHEDQDGGLWFGTRDNGLYRLRDGKLAGLKYDRKVWAEQWPRILANTVESSKRAGARLVFFDNVYMYGRVNGLMTEQTPFHPSSRKGEIRSRIADSLIDEWKGGKLTAMIARAADFYGPGAANGLPNTLVFDPLSKDKPAMCLAADNMPHSYTYIPDAADALMKLAETDSAWNQTWHLPTAPNPPTGREFIEAAAQAMGVTPRYRILGSIMLGIAGLFNPTIREVREMLYQNNAPYLFDSSKYARAFGFAGTPYADGICATAASYHRTEA